MIQSRTVKVLVLSSSGILKMFATLVSTMVIARVLTKQDYATYRQTMLTYSFAVPFLTLGLPQALYYFLPHEEERPGAVLTENLLLLGCLGSVFALFLLFGGNRLVAARFSNPELVNTLLLIVPYPFFALAGASFSSCMMARQRAVLLAVFTLISAFVGVAAKVAVCLTWRTPAAVVLVVVVWSGICFLPQLKLMTDSCAGGLWRPTIRGMHEQLRYGVPLALAIIAGGVAVSMDKVIVSSMCPPKDFAIYVNGAFEVPVLGILTLTVSSVLMPDMVKYRRMGDNGQVVALWRSATVKCGTILIPMMVFLYWMAPQVMRVLFSAKYTESVRPFRVYLIFLILRCMDGDVLFLVAGRSHMVLIRECISLVVNLALSIFLVSKLGYIGAAIGTVVLSYVWTVPYTLLLSSGLYDTHWLRLFPFAGIGKAFIAAALGAVVFAIGPFVSQLPDLVLLAIQGPLYFGVAFLAADRLGLRGARDVLSLLWRRIVNLSPR